MFRKNKPVKIVGDSWAVYSYTYGQNQKAVISFDVELAKQQIHNGYEYSIRVIIYIPLVGRVLENGLPVKEELSKLQELESILLQLLNTHNVDYRFVGRMSYGGMREFVFQIEDVKPFRKCIKLLKKEKYDYKIELREEIGWRFFDEKIRPAPVFWQQITDQKVIMQLIKAGSNPQTTHLIEHTILGEKQKLIKLRDELIASGFVEISMADDSLTVGKKAKLDLDEIFNVTGGLFNYCEANGLKYDGWGTLVVK